MSSTRAGVLLALAAILSLAAVYPLLPDYYRSFTARVLILSVYSYGYAVCFRMMGVMSLGHAALFAAGMYGAGLYTIYVEPNPLSALLAGIAASVLASAALGALALRVGGHYLMIGTLLAAETLYLSALHFNDVTGGEQGRVLERGGTIVGALSGMAGEMEIRYLISLLALSLAVAAVSALSYSGLGRLIVALRDDEEKLWSLGYNTSAIKLAGFAVSGALSGASGALNALLYGYMGAEYAGLLNSVEPILWTLAGGPLIQVGPLIGCIAVNIVSDIARGVTRGHVFVVGGGLVALALAAELSRGPRGRVRGGAGA